jgi:Kef-type K+ transport system membrane component KefB
MHATLDAQMVLNDELSVVAFLAAVWLCEKACARLHVSPLLGQLLGGILCGPALLDFVPHVDAFRLLGMLGVLLLVVDSGLQVDVASVRRSSGRAFALALTGVAVPVAVGYVAYTQGYAASWRTALSVGAALAPTSLGFTSQLLRDEGLLATKLGSLVCTAAVVDDVLSLALVAEIGALSGDGDISAWQIASPLVASLGCIVIGGALTLLLPRRVVAPAFAWLAARVSYDVDGAVDVDDDDIDVDVDDVEVTVGAEGDVAESSDTAAETDGGADADADAVTPPVAKSIATPVAAVPSLPAAASPRWLGDVQVICLLASAAVAAWLCALTGSSPLLGAFFAGLVFSDKVALAPTHRAWQRNIKRHLAWGTRLFFAATVAFGIPSLTDTDGGLFTARAAERGFVLSLVAIFGKLVVGVFAVPLTASLALQLGGAMNGRGEFSFLLADQGSVDGLLDDSDYVRGAS